MNIKQNLKYQRTLVATIVLLLAVILFITGTFAWNLTDKRNQQELMLRKGGRVHNDFNNHSLKAAVSNRANKDVYAENFGDNKLLVRIKLFEYLEIDGNAVTGESREDRNTWSPYVLGNNEEARNYVTWEMGGSKIFLPTFNLDENSDSIDAKGTAIDVLTGSATGIGDGTHNYFEPAGSIFDQSGNRLEAETGTSHTSKSTIIQDREVISMEDWLMLGAKEQVGNFWVVDDDGWAYWADFLRPNTATSLLLDELIVDSEGMKISMYYAIDVVGEFAAEGEADTFYNGESEYGNASSNGQEVVDTILTKNRK